MISRGIPRVDPLVGTAETFYEGVKVHMPVVTLEERLGTFNEVDGTIDEGGAKYEATRCLNCGTYCYDKDQESEVAEEECA